MCTNTIIGIYYSNIMTSIWFQNFWRIILSLFLTFDYGSIQVNNIVYSFPKCTVWILLVSTTITLITPAACNIPLMLKHFQRDDPIFCHYMILIFSRAIPQSMHRARLKLSSTLYRQLPKLAFKITILAWIWVVWLWNINNHASILKGFKSI